MNLLGMKNICFYHKADYDGKSAGALVRMYCEAHNEEIKLIPISYEDKIDYSMITKDTRVFMVDFTACDREAAPEHRAAPMFKIKELAGDFIWIDHHGTSIMDVDNYYIKGIKFQGVRNIKFSGTELTWMYLFDLHLTAKNNRLLSPNFGMRPIYELSPDDPIYYKQVPRIIYLLGRYDVWAKHLESWNEILAFQYGMRLYGDWKPEDDVSFKKWRKLIFGHEMCNFEGKVTRQGNIVLEYLEVNDANYIGSFGYEVEVKYDDESYSDFKFFAVNGGQKNSNVFKSLEGKYDAFIVYIHTGKEWTVSIYSFNPKHCNVALICKEFGGGGHPGAAGFVWPLDKPLPFTPINSAHK